MLRPCVSLSHLFSVIALLALGNTPAFAQDSSPSRAAEEPLVVEIIDPARPKAPLLIQDGLPILFEGLQPRDFDELRRWLRSRAQLDGQVSSVPGAIEDPARLGLEWLRRYGRLEGDAEPEIRPGRRVSSRSLVIRSDATQAFGYVQAVLQIASIMPGKSITEELERSPLLYKVSIELEGRNRRVATPLLVEAPPVSAGKPTPLATEILLRIPSESARLPLHQRPVLLQDAGSKEPFGECTGLAFLSENHWDFALQLDPPETWLRLRERFRALRRADFNGALRLSPSPQASFGVVFSIIEAASDQGIADIRFSALPPAMVAQIETQRAPSGLSDLLDSLRSEKAALRLEVDEPIIGDPSAKGPFAIRKEGRRNVRALGGGGKSQRAVDDGLEWLARHQSSSGSWDSDGFSDNCASELGSPCEGHGAGVHDVGVSGLAVLAFLGAGHDHRTGSHKNTVAKGLKWLKEQQDSEGCFSPRGDPRFSYNHAIATLAMAEAYGMTKSAIWKEPAQRGLNFATQIQNPYKGWRYGSRPGDNDTSVTSWMVMALHAGKLSKLEVSETSIQWARDYIDEMTDQETGRTGYTRRGERPVRNEGDVDRFPAHESESLTAAGMLGRILSGENPKSSPMIRKGAELLKERLPRWDPEAGSVDMIYWYFGSMAMFQLGGGDWTRWNTAMEPAIVENQRRGGCAKGSFDPIGPWGKDGGRVYATALMTLCLEAYYRYERLFG